MKSDTTAKALLFVIALLLATIAFRQHGSIETSVHAQTARFDHIHVIAANYLYKGEPGMLMLDKRNGNVWFMQRKGVLEFDEPVFLIHIPFEKLDQAPPQP